MPDPKGFDYFLRGRPLPTVGGESETTGLDYFLRGRPFPSIQTVGGAAPAEIADNLSRNNSIHVAAHNARQRVARSFRPAIFGSQLQVLPPNLTRTQPAEVVRDASHHPRIRRGLAFRTNPGRRELVVVAEEITRRSIIAHDPDPQRRLRKLLELQLKGGRPPGADGPGPALVARDPDAKRRYKRPLAFRTKGATGPGADGPGPAVVVRDIDHRRRYRQGLIVQLDGGRREFFAPPEVGTWPITVVQQAPGYRRRGQGLTLRTAGAARVGPTKRPSILLAYEPDNKRRRGDGLFVRTLGGVRTGPTKRPSKLLAQDPSPIRRRIGGYTLRTDGASRIEANGTSPARITRDVDHQRRYRQALVAQLDGGRREFVFAPEFRTFPSIRFTENYGYRRRGVGSAIKLLGARIRETFTGGPTFIVGPRRTMIAGVDKPDTDSSSVDRGSVRLPTRRGTIIKPRERTHDF